ncbi:HD domain-containing protein [bacterium]|nr:HD domain-containing protein [bacterium]
MYLTKLPISYSMNIEDREFMSHFEKKISGYLSSWREIRSLRALDNDALKKFWEQLDDAVEVIRDNLATRQDLANQYPIIASVIIKLLGLGEYIRVEALSLYLFEAANKTKDQFCMIRAQVFLGYVYFNLSEFQNAHKAYLKGLSMLGDDLVDQVRRVVFLSNLSMVAVENEDLELAVKYAHEAQNIINTTSPEAFNQAATKAGTPKFEVQRSAVTGNLGAIYQALGSQTDNAIERDRLLNQATLYDRRSSVGNIPLRDRIRAQANRGSTMISRGMAKEAYSLFKQLNRRCTSNPELSRMKAWIQGFMSEAALQMGDVDRSIKHCHESMRLAILSADPIREIETMRAALNPLKTISSEAFKGSHSDQSFLNKGMPVIMELLNFLEDKDWYTAQDHSRGVSRIALQLFDVMTDKYPDIEPETDRDTLEIASLLHDIGKLWIPWGILNRITPLWDREFDIIRKHPDMGRTFLEELGFSTVGVILGRHHERPDGAGYPHGGDIGGIADRILAVADCFEAMTTSNRLYHKPLLPEAAIRKMIALAGKQFDDAVVNTLPAAVAIGKT